MQWLEPMTNHLLGKWRGALLAVVALAMLLAFVPGCDKKAQDAAPAGSATPDPGASVEVTPPAPIVSGDPEIPLNEAVVGTTPVPADYAADTAPPAPVVEDKPAMPETGNVWAPGYWWWSTPFHRYVWVSGAWRNPPPPDQVWTPGQWVAASPTRYIWAPGFWAAPGTPAPAPIQLAPPPPRLEAYGAPPGVGFIWTPGFYAWRGESYFWTEGSWLRPPAPGLGWVEARYVGIGGRYYYQPGRWDFGPERRGTCYRPDINVTAGMHLTPVPVPQNVVVAHATYVTNSMHAISLGATRTPSGGYVVPRSALEQHPGTPVGRIGNEPPGGGPHPGNEPQEHPAELHPGTEVGRIGNEPHGAPPVGAEEHPAELHPGTEVGHIGPEHGGTGAGHPPTHPTERPVGLPLKPGQKP
jgi:hypothetical protein